MFRVSMPIVLFTLAACSPVAPVESAADAPAGASADAVADSGSGADMTTATSPGGGGVTDGASGAVEGSTGSGEVQPVPEEQIRVGPGLGDESCKAEAAQGMIGRSASEAVVKDATRVTGAKSVRVIPHDGMVTMDYRGDRLNIQLDEQGKIVAITCG
jgi:hypothetical protein